MSSEQLSNDTSKIALDSNRPSLSWSKELAHKALFSNQLYVYVSRMKHFSREDWLVYLVWVGLMVGLFAVVGGFILTGWLNRVHYPAYVWNIPIGIMIFTVSIAIDTVGHRTVYKEELMKAEAFVHHITIFCGIASCVFLTMAYNHPEFMRVPALVMIFLSVFYSMIDEAMHWKRYLDKKSDKVEMWSHLGIFVGHLIMILAWWHWYTEGYPGVLETLNSIKI